MLKGLFKLVPAFKVGNGVDIDPWRDPWLPWSPEKVLRPREGKCIMNINDVNNSWREDLIRELCKDDLAKAVMEIEIPRVRMDDKLL